MSLKRRANHHGDLQNKVAKTETEIVVACPDTGKLTSNSYSKMSDLVKAYISEQTDKIEKQIEKALQMKDYKYADLKHEKDTFELQSKSLETVYLSKYSKLEVENNKMKLKLKKQEEERDHYTKKVEKLVEAYKINVNNQNDEVKLLQCEIDSLKNKETFLKSSLDSMELDVKNTNKQLVDKDDAIKYLEKDLLDNSQEITKMKEVSLQQMEEVAFYKKVNEELENRVASLEIEHKGLLSQSGDIEQNEKERNEFKECIEILQSDLVEKNQEVFDLKSLKNRNEERIYSLEKEQSETQEELKEGKVEIERIEADLVEKNQEILNLKSLNTSNEEKLISLEEELKERMIDLEKRETSQKQRKAQEIFQRILVEKLENDLVERKQEILNLTSLNTANEAKICSLENKQNETQENFKETKFELEKYTNLQKQIKADLVEKNQEIYNLKSSKMANKEKICSLEQSQSEMEDILKERKVELDGYEALQKQMKEDLWNKSQEIFNLKSLNAINEEKISSLEQKKSETEEELKERKIDLEKCTTLQKQTKAQEIFQRILTEKLENKLKNCESLNGQLKKENETIMLTFNEKEKKNKDLKSSFNIQDSNEKFRTELENKNSKIEKQKSEICVLETQFREKVSEYHILSKTCAELEKQHGADVTLVKVLENLNVKYCKKIKFFKKEVQRLGGNSSILETKSSENSEKSLDDLKPEQKTHGEEFKYDTKEEEVAIDHKLHDTLAYIKKEEDLMGKDAVGKYDLRRRLKNKSESSNFFKHKD